MTLVDVNVHYRLSVGSQERVKCLRMGVPAVFTPEYGPLKMNYETLGNTVPHLHTHLIPRYVADPNPGGPFPLGAANAAAVPVPDRELEAQALALRERLSPGTQPG